MLQILCKLYSRLSWSFRLSNTYRLSITQGEGTFNSNEWFMYICHQVIQHHYKQSQSYPFGELLAMKNEVLIQNGNKCILLRWNYVHCQNCFDKRHSGNWYEHNCSILGYNFIIQIIRLLWHNKQEDRKWKKLNIVDLHTL